MSRSRVTIRDVAALAEVSRQTVSRVTNGSQSVSPATRARVEQAIATLGYRPDASARSMARGRSGYLACISPNLTDYSFASIIEAAEAEAREHGYYLMSTSAPDVATFAQLMTDLTESGRAEGVMVVNPYSDERHQYVPAAFPTVFTGARPREDGADSVMLDDVAVARQITDHLISLGHRRIGMVTGPPAEDCTQDRSRGYYEALAAAGIDPDPDLIVEGNWLPASGYEAFQHWFAAAGPSYSDNGRPLSGDEKPTALFAQNDQMALGVLRAAGDAGVVVPDELSVIGVDNIPLAAYFSPPLTTVHQDFARIGQLAARLLIRVVEAQADEHEHHLLSGEMIIRRSTGAPGTALPNRESPRRK